MTTSVIITRLPHGEGLPLPRYATAGAAGADLHSAADVTIGPGGRAIVPTGIRMSLPPMMEGQIRPRSGLAARDGVTVLNAPGTIDSDYRGEVLVLLVNHGLVPFEVRRGDRIAQIVFAWTLCPRMVELSDIDETARGAGGLGSTGVRP